MAAIVWDEVSKRLFETGVNKGVFYDFEGHGVPWNGLTSVEVNTPSKVDPIYFDGVKFNDFVIVGDFSGTMKAFTYPEEFLPYEGVYQDTPGFFITDQQTNRFGLSFQTRIGNDVDSIDYGYKIHLLYDLTALPAERSFETLALDVEPVEFEWTITGIPQDIEGFRPTAHVIIDSNKFDPYLLKDVEDILYGTLYDDPILPPLKTLSTYIRETTLLRLREG
jgi:hypothetical protein